MAKHWRMGTDFNLEQVEKDAVDDTIDVVVDRFSGDLKESIKSIKDQFGHGKVKIDVVVTAVEEAA